MFCLIILFATSNQAQYGYDTDWDYLVTITTEYGQMKALLFEDTPLHRENFVTLTQKGVFNGCTFHRVIDHFMIQTGDPGTREKPLTPVQQEAIQPPIPAEILPHHLHHRGAIGAARRGGKSNPYRKSSPTQFYIVENHEGAHHLDGEYTVFGQVTSGLEVIDKIAAVETGPGDKPLKNTRMEVKVEKVSKENVEKFYNFSY